MSTESEKQFNFFAGAVAFLLALAIAAVMIHGDSVDPKVTNFNLAEERVRVSEDQLILSFNREMDKESVEAAFDLQPKLEGQFSWAGRKLFYTLSEPLSYGQDYILSLNATDKNGREMTPFSSHFSSFEKELFYIRAENGMQQVVGYKADSDQLTEYSPENLFVLDFDFAQGGKTIVFLALDASILEEESLEEADGKAELYMINLETQELKQLTDDEDILNFAMVLAPDGQTILMERLNLTSKKGEAFGYSYLSLGELSGDFEPFWYANLNAYQFDFTPDSKWLLVLNSEGFSLLPSEITGGPPQFLGNFISYQDFSQDGSQLAFIQWKDEDIFAATSEVILMHQNGDIETLLSDIGVVDSLRFNFNGDAIYTAIFESYLRDNALYRYDLETEQIQQLTAITDSARYSRQTSSVDEEELGYEYIPDTGESEVRLLDLSTGEKTYSASGSTPRWR